MVFFFKQKTAYEMRISDWSSDVCSSGLNAREFAQYKKEYYEDAAIYEGYTDGVPERYQNPEQYDENSGTDWYDVLLRDALTQNYNLSLSTGVSDLKSAVNLNYNKREGVVINTFSEDRKRTRLNSSH